MIPWSKVLKTIPGKSNAYHVCLVHTGQKRTSQAHLNKKVLREHKRHTNRGVSSTSSVTRGGVPPPAVVPPWPGVMAGTRGGVP